MFIDKVKFTITSGKGGPGCSSFRKEKFVVNGGPDGGDGGKGGDVYFLVDNNTDTLSWYKGKTRLKADNGRPGMGRRKTGKSADPLILVVPPGTQVIDGDTNVVLLDLVVEGQKELFLEGGLGGKGNWHFKNSRNQAPTYAQTGIAGIEKNIKLELKLIADVGLVGFPNVGKSTLISVCSNAEPQIANYEFTTLTPKLGVVEVGEYNSFVMADIPGIIEGASDGKGLGLDFLQHIERTESLLYMIDVSNYRDMIEQYKILKEEVKKFSNTLENRNFVIALTKIDTLQKDELNDKIKSFIKALDLDVSRKNQFGFDPDFEYFIQDITYNKYDENLPYCIVPISSATHTNISSLKYLLYDFIHIEGK